MQKKRTIKVSVIVVIVLIASFFLACLRLGQIALSREVDGIDIAEFAKNRNTTTKSLYASRGTIYDVNGETLAQSVNSYTVVAYLSESRTKDMNNPRHVIDKEKTARELSPLINMSEEDILSRLNMKMASGATPYQVELRPGGAAVSELLKQQIEGLELPGIGFIKSTKRYYKMATLAPYIVGYARADDDGKITGEMGIESYYNYDLEGEDGSSTYETDAYGYRLPNSTEKRIEPKEGKDIYLTIDSNIQMFLEQAVQGLSEKNNMSWLTFTIADAKTGAILGSASNPTFNLNKQDMKSYLDPLVSYQYEPGSTMKIYSFLAAMEAGKYNGEETYQSGELKVGDTAIHDFNEVGWGMIPYDEGFARSSNTASAKLALKIGAGSLRDFYEKAGFGKKTGITLPGEVDGTIKFTYESEIATAAFGQGITTTPIQNIQALTMIANDGVMLKPYIVDKIVDPASKEVIYQGGREEVGQVASKDSIDKIRKLMSDAIYLNLTDAKYYQPDNIKMIGKTGTANIPSPKGGYLPASASSPLNYVRSFAGLFPADEPKYVMYVSVKQFDGSIKKLADAVKTVVEEVAKYKNIDEKNFAKYDQEIITLDNYLNTSVEETEEKLKALRLTPVIIGDGKYVIKLYPNYGNKVLAGSKVFIKTSNNDYIMPDVTNWSENEIVTFCNFIGLRYNVSGYGRVKTQSIAVGEKITSDSVLTVELE